MSDRDLTPEELSRAAEVAAVMKADIQTSLAGQPKTPAAIKRALLESAKTLMPLAEDPVVEHDAEDPTKLNVFVPADWFTAIARRKAP